MPDPSNAPKPTAPTRTLLELVQTGPIRSKPFLFRKLPARWRVLNSSEIQQCRTAAQRVTMAVLVDDMGLEPKDAFPLLQAGTLADTEREWFEMYCLGAALTDEHGAPVSMGSPDEVAQGLINELTPMERARLIDDWLQFTDEYDPSTISEEEIEGIIADAGKMGGASTWKQYGSNALRSLLAIMAPRLIKAEMAVAEMEEKESLESRVATLEAAALQTHK